MTSLVQAKTINSSGVYIVGHLNTNSCPPTGLGRRLSFNDVIRLTVPTKDGSEEEQSKTYSADELNDLQSKLMLISGKAESRKDEVEQFVKASFIPNIFSKCIESCKGMVGQWPQRIGENQTGKKRNIAKFV